MKQFDPQKFLEENCQEELANGLVYANRVYEKVYKKGYMDCAKDLKHEFDNGYITGVQHVRNAIKWFRDTYGTEYVLYDADSVDNLLNLYKEASLNE